MLNKMDALILAAGFGTRLYPLTQDIPKGLIKINNKPLIEYTLKKINDIPDIDTIYILSNNKFYNHFLEWLDNFKHFTNQKIRILNDGVNKESEAKGVLGDLEYILNITDQKELLILGSDNLYCFDLNGVIKKGREKQASATAIRRTDKESIKKYSEVLLDKNDKIIYFKEKPQKPRSDLASIFCYYLIKKDLDKIKSQTSKLVDNIIFVLYKETEIYGYYFTEPWFDIGSFEDLKNTEKYFANAKQSED